MSKLGKFVFLDLPFLYMNTLVVNIQKLSYNGINVPPPSQYQQIRESTLHVSDVGMENAGASARPTRNHQKEVMIVRAAIRKANYLSFPHGSQRNDKPRGSTDICNDLVDFSIHAKNQTENYFRQNLHGDGSVMEELCVTSTERDKRNKMQTMSCEELQELIRGELVKLQPSQAVCLTAEYSRICKDGTRHDHIVLLYDIFEELETSEPSEPSELETSEPID